jgi:hypothetical protein
LDGGEKVDVGGVGGKRDDVDHFVWLAVCLRSIDFKISGSDES